MSISSIYTAFFLPRQIYGCALLMWLACISADKPVSSDARDGGFQCSSICSFASFVPNCFTLAPAQARSSFMAAVRWADICDDSDDDGLGPWAAYPARPRSPSPPPQPPARGRGLRWADVYDGEDDSDLGPWANYPTGPLGAGSGKK